MTPREFRWYMRGRREKQKIMQALGLSTVWHQVAFSRARVGKNLQLPDLKNIIRKVVGKRKRPQTPAEALRVAVALNKLFGGKDVRHLTKRS